MESIFKSYDIRGIYPSELDEEKVYQIGKAYAVFLEPQKIVVGYDMRVSSQKLRDALVRGLTEMGVDVSDIGMCSTPMFYFAIANYGFDGGIMVTASHNPGRYNGLKMCRENAIPIGKDTGLLEIKKMSEGRGLVQKSAPLLGTVTRKDIFDDYTKHVFSFADIGKIKNTKIIVDCGNGVAGASELKVLKLLGCKLDVLCEKPDGNFPNHEANPIKEENIKDLKKEVLKKKADVGIAFDGDCDRVVFVDEKGEAADSSLIAALIATELLKKKSEKVVYSVITGKIVPETVKKLGGAPIMNKVGHAYIKETMRKENIAFAVEKSGHFYYRENFYAESSVITVLKVLQLLSESGKSFSELLEPYRKYSTAEEMSFEVEDKDKAIERVKQHYKKLGANIYEIDGVTVEFPNWWFNIRKSGTEPLLRVNLEADTAVLMREKVKEVKELIV